MSKGKEARERKRLRNVDLLQDALGDAGDVHYMAMSGEAVVRGDKGKMATFWPISCKWRSSCGIQLGRSIEGLVRYMREGT